MNDLSLSLALFFFGFNTQSISILYCLDGLNKLNQCMFGHPAHPNTLTSKFKVIIYLIFRNLFIFIFYFGYLQGPVHAYVSVPGGKTCYLSELKSGKEVIVVDQSGNQRTAVVGRVKIETRPLILVEAKVCAAYFVLLKHNNIRRLSFEMLSLLTY